MNKNLTIASVLGMIAILLGAFGAHALKSKLSADGLSSFETAVRYQMFHVLVLLFVNTYIGFSSAQKKAISFLLIAGILFFSGSIYAIQLTEISAKNIWFVTPLGGILFIVGWAKMALVFMKKKSTIDS